MRSSALLLALIAVCLLPSGEAAAAARGCARADAERMLRGKVPAAELAQIVCADLTGDLRRELVVTRFKRGRYGAREWAVFARRGGRTRLLGSGDGGRRSRGLMRIAVRGGDLIVTVPRWLRGDPITCPSGGLRERRLRRRAGRFAVVKRTVRRPRRPCDAGEPKPGPRVPVTAGTRPACLNADPAAPDIRVGIRKSASLEALGKVLPGLALRPTVAPHSGVRPIYSSPLLARYPEGGLGGAPAPPANIEGVTPDRLVPATASSALFNGDEARHRVAHDQSYFGLSPIGVGDLDGDGIEDLAHTAHWSAVDGQAPTGEVHVYRGRRHPDRIDPRRDLPDLLLYGSTRGDKFGIEVAPAGDMDGDGAGELLISAAYQDAVLEGGTRMPLASRTYLLYGGRAVFRHRCPVKVRAGEIGRKVPGLVLEGGHLGTGLVGWSNTLDGGDLDGDGLSDAVLGAYDPHSPRLLPPFPARAFAIYGSRRRVTGRHRLGRPSPAVRETVVELPEADWSHQSLGFQTSVLGDLNRDGADELAISATRAGPGGGGGTYILLGRRGGLPRGRPISVEEAEVRVVADAAGEMSYSGIAGARPAGDVNGDGYPDVQISSRTARRAGPIVGAVGVLLGGPGLGGEIGFSELAVILTGSTPGGSVGFPGMNRGADLDRDGFADLLINDPYYPERIGDTTQYRGRLWMVRGGPTLPRFSTVEQSAHRIFVADLSLPGLYGFQWNTADPNGDGRPDVIVGDHYLGDRATRERPGGAYLFYNGIDAGF